MKVVIAVLVSVLAGFILFLFLVKREGYQNEIIVRTITNLKTSQDVETLINLCAENNIHIISVAFKQDEDDEVRSGEVFYPSSIAPVVVGYENQDILKILIEKAHANSIMIKAWIPQFHDQVAYAKNPEWGMVAYHDKKLLSVYEKSGEYFVNPLHEEVQNYELSIIKEIVQNYDIDGVVLDWIRFDDYNMDLSEYTRKKYQAKFGYDPLMIDFSKESRQRKEWNTYRGQEIALYIKKVRIMIKDIKPDVDLGVYVLSPSWSEVGQDPALFYQDIDSVSPMCYYDDWEYPVDWIYGPRDDSILVVTDAKVKGTDIVPVFDTDWKDETYHDIFQHLKTTYPHIKTLSWFEYGKWSAETIRRVSSLGEDTKSSK